MTVTFYPSRLCGTVKSISSKSYLHRLLIASALCEGHDVKIKFNGLSEDIKATISAISSLGRGVKIDGDEMTVYDETPCGEIDVRECGSTFRFMLSVISAAKKIERIKVNGADVLASRPISPLYEELLKHGAILSEKGKFPMTVEGKLQSGVFEIDGSISSQYVSGLLMALPTLCGDSEIRIKGKLSSKPYVDITLECLSRFNIDIKETDYGYFIKGNRQYMPLQSLVCEGDYSNAAFFLVAGAMSEDFVGVSNLSDNTNQGDSAIIDIISKFGGMLRRDENGVAFSRGGLCGTDIDAENIPDLVPILSLMASVSQGKTVIYNAERLKFKESNRLKTTTELLSTLGADIKETNDGLVICGKEALNGGVVSASRDHRIAMTAAIASAVATDKITVQGFEAVNKSYPGFLDDFKALGGKFVRED